jgi:hypothetical protein
MPAEIRKAAPPWVTEDVAPSQQIIPDAPEAAVSLSKIFERLSGKGVRQ